MIDNPMKDINTVVAETVNNYVERKMMLNEYKNPNDAETIRVCAEMLASLHDKIVGSGVSKHEITVEKIAKVVDELKRIEAMMGV